MCVCVHGSYVVLTGLTHRGSMFSRSRPVLGYTPATIQAYRTGPLVGYDNLTTIFLVKKSHLHIHGVLTNTPPMHTNLNTDNLMK